MTQRKKLLLQAAAPLLAAFLAANAGCSPREDDNRPDAIERIDDEQAFQNLLDSGDVTKQAEARELARKDPEKYFPRAQTVFINSITQQSPVVTDLLLSIYGPALWKRNEGLQDGIRRDDHGDRKFLHWILARQDLSKDDLNSALSALGEVCIMPGSCPGLNQCLQGFVTAANKGADLTTVPRTKYEDLLSQQDADCFEKDDPNKLGHKSLTATRQRLLDAYDQRAKEKLGLASATQAPAP